MGYYYDYEFVKNYIESNNCKLISKEYVSIKSKLIVEGQCGHVYNITFDAFKNAKRYFCRSCGLKRGSEKRKVGIDQVRKYAESKGCVLLSTEYKDNSTNIEFLFSCGHTGKRSWAGLKKSYDKCPNCFKNSKKEFNNVNEYLNNNGYFLKESKYTGVNDKMVIYDSSGYYFMASLHHISVAIKRDNYLREFDISNPFTIKNIKNWLVINNKSMFLLSDIYNGKDKKLIWECLNSVCGEKFETSWHTIMRGSSCPYCSVPAKKVGLKNNLEILYPDIACEWDFFKNKNKSPFDILPGSNTIYWWICKECKNSWKASCNSRTNSKSGCPECNQSHGEKEIKRYLNSVNIKYIYQYKFNDCKHKKELLFDFYLPLYNIAIEFNGKQHFESIEYFGGIKQFRIQQKRDNIKRKYCKDNNIKLLEIPYWDFNNIESILEKELFLGKEVLTIE